MCFHREGDDVREKTSEESRREQVVQAALWVATCEGLEQLTMRLIAAEAGLRIHFLGKEEVSS